MFFWFIGTAIVAVWYVFRDPRFDYRLLVVGSVLPLGDALFALGDGPGMRWMHSLAFSVALLAAVMAITAGRKPQRKLRRMRSGCPSARSSTSCSMVRGQRRTCSGGRSAAGTWRGIGCPRCSAGG